MARLLFDRRQQKSCQGNVLRYGILRGNSTIVLIKAGANGTCRGYGDKHLKMGLRLRQQLGCTVICASNPCLCDESWPVDKKLLEAYAAEQGFASCKLYLVGHSDGADQMLKLAHDAPNAEKLLLINPSAVSLADLIYKLKRVPHGEKWVVYGKEDEQAGFRHYLIPAGIPKLTVHTVLGADHDFTNMPEDYIALGDLLV